MSTGMNISAQKLCRWSFMDVFALTSAVEWRGEHPDPDSGAAETRSGETSDTGQGRVWVW